MGTIYVLENKINNKCYVGQTTYSFKKRYKSHLEADTYLGRALRKHPEDFTHYEYNGINNSLLDQYEIDKIKQWNSLYPSGYNFQTGGRKNQKHNDATKAKISKLHKGKVNSEETRQKMSKAKLNMSDDTKRKMSESAMGNKKGIGNKGNTGPVSDETKKKLSEKAKKQWADPTKRKNIMNAQKGAKRG